MPICWSQSDKNSNSSSLCRFLEHCMWSNHKGRQNQQNKTHIFTSHLISHFQVTDSWKSREVSHMFTTAVKYPAIVIWSLAAKSFISAPKSYKVELHFVWNCLHPSLPINCFNTLYAIFFLSQCYHIHLQKLQLMVFCVEERG